MSGDLVFIPGEDFDPYDYDEVAAVKLAMDRDMADRQHHGLGAYLETGNGTGPYFSMGLDTAMEPSNEWLDMGPNATNAWEEANAELNGWLSARAAGKTFMAVPDSLINALVQLGLALEEGK